MWRVGVLVLFTIVIASEAAEIRYGGQLLRLRRSPHYDCQPFYPPPRPYWPPPPRHFGYPHHHFGPPPFWPPPPPPQEQDGELQPQQQTSSQSQAESSAMSGALKQQFEQGQERGQSQDRGQSQGEESYPSNPPCETCKGHGQNSAISNAKSDSGSAIAIAISGKNGRK